MAPTRRESLASWNIVSDIFDASTPNISKLLRSKTLYSELNYRDRIFIGTFAFVNGIDPDLLRDALYLNPQLTESKLRKILDLYNYFGGTRVSTVDELKERRKRYFTYSIYERHFVDLNNHYYTLRK